KKGVMPRISALLSGKRIGRILATRDWASLDASARSVNSQPAAHPCLVGLELSAKQRRQGALLGCNLESVHVQHEAKRPEQGYRRRQISRQGDQKQSKADVHGIS